MPKRLLFLGIIWMAAVQVVSAQIGGRSVFRFLNVPTHARVAALGGVNISSGLQEVNAVSENPALMQGQTAHHISFTHLGYLSDISQNNLQYAFNSSRWGNNAIGVQYLDYGDFVQRDAGGVEEGTFKVRDYAVSLSHSATIAPFTLGATLKLAVSSIAGNQAVATLLDLGGVFKHPEKDLTVGLAIRNLGVMLKPYDGTAREEMPLDIQLGVSYKPEHAPFRVSLTGQQLQKFDIVYLDPTQSTTLDENNQEVEPKKTFGDKLARHFVVGTELLLSEGFQLRAGYNHLRNRELRVENVGSMAGISLGATLKISAIRFDYTYAKFHVAGASNYITLTADLNRFLKKSDI